MDSHIGKSLEHRAAQSNRNWHDPADLRPDMRRCDERIAHPLGALEAITSEAY